MKTVRQLLEIKGYNVYSISPEATLYQALTRMAETGVGALLVMDGDELVGIVSERDYARKVVLKGRSATDTPVKEIMTSQVICVAPQQTTDECMVLMTDKRIRHLPVVEHGKLIGIISIGDVVKAVISEQEFLIQQLEHYITGR